MLLQRSIFRELVLTFCFILGVTTVIFIVGSLFQLIGRMEGMGVGLIFQTFPSILGYVLPFTSLVAAAAATTLVYARLAAQNELIAMQVNGIPVRRAMMPAVLFGVILCVVSFWFNDVLAPAAHYSRRVMIKTSIIEFLKNPPKGESALTLDNYKISYDSFTAGEFRSVVVAVLEEGKLRQKLVAKRGKIDFDKDPPVFRLYDCQSATFDIRKGSGGGDITVVEDTFLKELPVPLAVGDLFDQIKRPKDMESGELLEYLRGDKVPDGHEPAGWTELYARYARSAAPLFLILVCVAIGVMVRRGSRLAGLGASLPPLILYFVLSILGEGMSSWGGVHPIVGAFFGAFILAAFAGVLLFPVART